MAIKTIKLLLAFLMLCCIPAYAAKRGSIAGFRQSFVAGTLDPNSNTMDGTELRDLLFTTIPNGASLPSGGNCAHPIGCPTLMAFTGFWQDNACTNGQGPQAIALTTSKGNWYLDTTFGGTPTCGGASFNVVNSAYDYFVTYDGNGVAVPQPVEVVLVGGIQTASGADFYARNNAAGTWSTVAHVGPAGSALRTIADHEDDNTGVGSGSIDYALLYDDSDGPHSATWLLGTPPAFAYTINATPENFCQSWSSGTTCTTPCGTNSVPNCTNLQTLWPDQLAVTSESETGTHITLNWTTALAAPLSPGYSKIDVIGVTGAGGCSGLNALQLVTSQTATSATFASTVTGCTYTSAVVSTPANVTFGWSGALGFSPTGTVTVSSGTTGCVGADPTGTHTIGMSSTTSIQFSLDTDCNAGGGTVTVSGTTPSSWSKTVNSWSSTVPSSQAASPTRIVSADDCPVTSGGNTAGMAQFLDVGMNIWQRVDKGSTSFWRIKGVIPYPSAGIVNGQAQLRGMTCIVDSTKTHGYALLGHIEGDGGMWSMDPNTGIFNNEDNLITEIQSQWGWGTYGIDIYNSDGVVQITVGGKTYNIFSEGDAYAVPATQPYEAVPSHVTAVSGFWVRAITSPASPSAPSYTVFPTLAQQQSVLNQIAPSTPQPPAQGGSSYNPCANAGTGNCPLMVSTRAGPIVSQFPEDAGSVLFFGGFDANSTGVHSTAWIGRVPVSMFSWP